MPYFGCYGAFISHSYCVNSLNSESLVHAEQVTFSGVTLDHFIVESLMTLLKEFPSSDGNGTNCRKTKSERKWKPRKKISWLGWRIGDNGGKRQLKWLLVWSRVDQNEGLKLAQAVDAGLRSGPGKQEAREVAGSLVLAEKASSDSLVWQGRWTGKRKTDCHVLGKEK